MTMLIVGAFGTLCTVAWLIVLWSSDKKGPAGKARDFARAAAELGLMTPTIGIGGSWVLFGWFRRSA
jgi:hypothetical protein